MKLAILLVVSTWAVSSAHAQTSNNADGKPSTSASQEMAKKALEEAGEKIRKLNDLNGTGGSLGAPNPQGTKNTTQGRIGDFTQRCLTQNCVKFNED